MGSRYGIVLAAAAVSTALAVIAFAGGCGSDDDSVAADCILSPAQLQTVVGAVNRGTLPADIAGKSIAGVPIPASCRAMIVSIADTPELRVRFTLRGANGNLTQNHTGSYLRSPAPPEISQLPRAALSLACIKAFPESHLLYSTCRAGLITP